MSAGMVIIGGGQAGGWAAKTLRDQGYNGSISIIADEPWDFYERPPLSKAALLQSDAPLARLFSEDTQRALHLRWYRPVRAEQILPEQKQLLLNNGETLPYDKLLIATGSRPRWPDSAWQAHPRVMALRNWQDAQALKQALNQCRRLAVVGGGWIGLEIAASARSKGIDVTLFERQALLCQRSVNPQVSQALWQLHQQQGVDLQCDCGEIQLSDAAGYPQLTSAKTATQTFDLVVVGIGIELNLELAAQAGLAIDHGIVINGQGQTSDPAIFAAGDVARHPELGISLQSWAFAQNQAQVAAKAMLDATTAAYQEIPWLWSDQYHCNIQILGLPAEGDTIHRPTASGGLWFTLDNQQRLQQLVAIDDARTIKLAKRWIAAERVLDPAQLADTTFSLMTLR